jgi:hypothetical protein
VFIPSTHKPGQTSDQMIAELMKLKQ